MGKKFQNRNEFRKNKVSGHPAYIYAKVGKEYKYIGLTHSPITEKTKNIKLEKSPNPNDSKETYIRPKGEKLKQNKFSKDIYKNWSFTEKDQSKVNCIKKRTK